MGGGIGIKGMRDVCCFAAAIAAMVVVVLSADTHFVDNNRALLYNFLFAERMRVMQFYRGKS